MKTRAAVAAGLATVLFGCYLAISGAPSRVHAATCLGLAIAFVLPALLVDRPRDVWTHRWVVLATIVTGIAVLDLAMTATISKKEVLDAPGLFVAGIPAMLGLLMVHGLIVRQVRRKRAV